MKSPRHVVAGALVAACAALSLVGCSSESTASTDSDRFTMVVTTSIWGNVIENAFGDQVAVTVLIPPDVDPHHFEPSTKMAAELESTDLIVANGAGLEAEFGSVIDSVEQTGTPVFTIADHVATRTVEPHEGDDESDEGHDDGPVDPHVWLDPELVAQAVEALATELEAAGVDGAISRAATYRDMLTTLDADLSARLEPIPADRRVLVTSHDSLGYYADAYDLTVVDTILGSVSTDAEPSVAGLEGVVDAIDQFGVDAIFVDPGESDRLAAAIVTETDRDVEVVPLRTDGLGDSADYPSFMRATTETIAAALTP